MNLGATTDTEGGAKASSKQDGKYTISFLDLHLLLLSVTCSRRRLSLRIDRGPLSELTTKVIEYSFLSFILSPSLLLNQLHEQKITLFAICKNVKDHGVAR